MTQRGDAPASPSALDADPGKAYAVPMSDSARSVVVTEQGQAAVLAPKRRARAPKAPPSAVTDAWLTLEMISRGTLHATDPRWLDIRRRACLDIVQLSGGDLRHLPDTELVGQRDRYNAEIARRNAEREP